MLVFVQWFLLQCAFKNKNYEKKQFLVHHVNCSKQLIGIGIKLQATRIFAGKKTHLFDIWAKNQWRFLSITMEKKTKQLLLCTSYSTIDFHSKSIHDTTIWKKTKAKFAICSQLILKCSSKSYCSIRDKKKLGNSYYYIRM